MNRISGMKHGQIITLWQAGKNAVWIAGQLGISRETVGDHLRKAGFRLPRGRPPSGGRKPAFSEGVPADLSIPDQNRQLTGHGCPPTFASLCEPHRTFIEGRVSVGQSAQVIWQDMVDDLSFRGGYDSVKRFVRKLKVISPEVFAVIPTSPGLEAQVDYGRGAPAIHPETGKFRRPRLFCMKLSHSRKAFRKVVWKSSTRIWCELHEEAFRYFGGVPETIRLDNLKEGVLNASIYDPEINPLYAAMLAHYGAVAIPCRVATPRHKGKVESEVKYTQNALKGRKFENFDDEQRFLDHWSRRWADTRIHGTIKRQVNEIFETEEKPALRPLPAVGFPILQIASRKVHTDGHIEVNGAFYSAPHTWVGREVTVHVGRCFIDLFHPSTGERIARHIANKRGKYHTVNEHLPDSKRTDRIHEWMFAKATVIGPATRQIVGRLLAEGPHHAIRTSQGIISFTKKYSKEDVEMAARLCVERNICSYRAMKNILERKSNSAQPQLPLLTQSHNLIRPPADYQLKWVQNQKGDIQ